MTINIKVTPQQKKALDLFYEGKNYQEIALALDVSYSRIINILNNILVKTKLSSRKELLLAKNELNYTVEE